VTTEDLNEARRFISEYINSAEQLDVLLLLHAERARSFNAAEVSQRVFTVPAAAILRLEELTAAGLVSSDRAPDPRYRYAPSTPELAARVDVLAATHRAQRVAVVQLVYQVPRDPVRSFADAFRLRRPED
jgi:hypothetical protein